MQNVHEVDPSGKAAWYWRVFMAVWLTRRVKTSSRAAHKHDVKRCRGLLTNKPPRRQTRQMDRRGRCQGERGMPSRDDVSARMTSPTCTMRRRSEQEAGRKQEGSRKSLLTPVDAETWCLKPTISQTQPWRLLLIYVLDSVKSAGQ